MNSTETPSSFFKSSYDQKFHCTQDDRLKELLAESFLESGTDHRLTYDFTSTPSHRLIFEFSLKKSSEKDTYAFFMRFFDIVFLNVFQKYVKLKEASFLLLTHPNQTDGFQIHVMGVEISYDDHIRLCDLIKEASQYEEEELSIYLVCPSSFILPSCEPVPIRLVHVQFEYHQESCVWYSRRLENVVYQHPKVDSFCSKVVNFASFWEKMVSGMVPFPRPNVTYVHFPMRIIEQKRLVNTILFRSYLDEKIYKIHKENILVEGKGSCYDFLKDNSNHIRLIYAAYPILETWYNRFKQTHSKLAYFRDVDMKLRKLCPHLKNEFSPLTTVFKAYERPVYYALYNMLRKKEDVALMREQFPFLSKDLPPVPPLEATELTFDTILYCAYLTGNGTFIGHLGTGYDWIIKSITSLDDLIDNVVWVQRKTYPVVRGPVDKHIPLYLRDPKVYFWDQNTQNWQRMEEPIIDIMDILRWSMEILNIHVKLPPELMKKFQEEKIEDLAYTVLSNTPEKKGHNITESLETYEYNVPEYYFLEDKI